MPAQQHNAEPCPDCFALLPTKHGCRRPPCPALSQASARSRLATDVLCVDEAYHTERLDPGLAGLLPAGIDIVKVPALSAARMRYFGIGDIGLRAYPYLSDALQEVISARKIDVVMITGSPFYPFLLARTVKRRFRCPVILDFQALGFQMGRYSSSAHKGPACLSGRPVARADRG